MLTALRLGTVLLTALALVPAGAHLFELPNKIGLPREAYLVAQGLYRGWALFGVVWFGALLANLALALALRLRWEYSHAANAVILFLALCLSVLSALGTAERQEGTGGP